MSEMKRGLFAVNTEVVYVHYSPGPITRARLVGSHSAPSLLSFCRVWANPTACPFVTSPTWAVDVCTVSSDTCLSSWGPGSATFFVIFWKHLLHAFAGLWYKTDKILLVFLVIFWFFFSFQLYSFRFMFSLFFLFCTVLVVFCVSQILR